MKGFLVVLLLAACIIHFNEGFYHGRKRSMMKELRDVNQDLPAAMAKDLRRSDFKELAPKVPEQKDVCELAKLLSKMLATQEC